MVENIHRTMTADDIQKLVGHSPTMLEIGSHEGSDTVKFLKAMPGIQLYCFEPDPRPIARFKEAIKGDPRVVLFEMAIADHQGMHNFYASTGKAGRREDWDFSGSLCAPTGHLTRSPEIKFKEPTPILCTSLDEWYNTVSEFNTISNVDFMWADVQGSQRLLIAGGRRVLNLTRYLYIESHDPVAYAGEPTQEELIEEIQSVAPLRPVSIWGKENILFERNNDV